MAELLVDETPRTKQLKELRQKRVAFFDRLPPTKASSGLLPVESRHLRPPVLAAVSSEPTTSKPATVLNNHARKSDAIVKTGPNQKQGSLGTQNEYFLTKDVANRMPGAEESSPGTTVDDSGEPGDTDDEKVNMEELVQALRGSTSEWKSYLRNLETKAKLSSPRKECDASSSEEIDRKHFLGSSWENTPVLRSSGGAHQKNSGSASKKKYKKKSSRYARRGSDDSDSTDHNGKGEEPASEKPTKSRRQKGLKDHYSSKGSKNNILAWSTPMGTAGQTKGAFGVGHTARIKKPAVSSLELESLLEPDLNDNTLAGLKAQRSQGAGDWTTVNNLEDLYENPKSEPPVAHSRYEFRAEENAAEPGYGEQGKDGDEVPELQTHRPDIRPISPLKQIRSSYTAAASQPGHTTDAWQLHANYNNSNGTAGACSRDTGTNAGPFGQYRSTATPLDGNYNTNNSGSKWRETANREQGFGMLTNQEPYSVYGQVKDSAIRAYSLWEENDAASPPTQGDHFRNSTATGLPLDDLIAGESLSPKQDGGKPASHFPLDDELTGQFTSHSDQLEVVVGQLRASGKEANAWEGAREGSAAPAPPQASARTVAHRELENVQKKLSGLGIHSVFGATDGGSEVGGDGEGAPTSGDFFDDLYQPLLQKSSVRVCPECGELNSQLVNWCLTCGCVLIGVEPQTGQGKGYHQPKGQRASKNLYAAREILKSGEVETSVVGGTRQGQYFGHSSDGLDSMGTTAKATSEGGYGLKESTESPRHAKSKGTRGHSKHQPAEPDFQQCGREKRGNRVTVAAAAAATNLSKKVFIPPLNLTLEEEEEEAVASHLVKSSLDEEEFSYQDLMHPSAIPDSMKGVHLNFNQSARADIPPTSIEEEGSDPWLKAAPSSGLLPSKPTAAAHRGQSPQQSSDDSDDPVELDQASSGHHNNSHQAFLDQLQRDPRVKSTLANGGGVRKPQPSSAGPVRTGAARPSSSGGSRGPARNQSSRASGGRRAVETASQASVGSSGRRPLSGGLPERGQTAAASKRTANRPIGTLKSEVVTSGSSLRKSSATRPSSSGPAAVGGQRSSGGRPSGGGPPERGQRSGGDSVEKSKTLQYIEEPAYRRHWGRSSIAWDSYGQGQLSTVSSLARGHNNGGTGQARKGKGQAVRIEGEKENEWWESGLGSHAIPDTLSLLDSERSNHGISFRPPDLLPLTMKLIHESPRSAEEGVSVWQLLPDEILLYIFSYLGHRDLATAAQVCRLFDRIAKDSSLWKCIVVKKREVTSDWLEEMGKKKPRRLELVQCQAAGSVTSGLRSLFRSSSDSLEELSISGCCQGQMSGDDLLLHATRCRKITFFDISWSNASNSALAAIADSSDRMETLCANGCQAITDEGLRIVTTKHRNSLRALEIFGCFNISSDTMRSVSAQCKLLRALNIGQCPKITAECIAGIPAHLKHLQTLDLQGSKEVSDGLVHRLVKDCRSLTSLCLANCPHLTDNSLTEIATYCPSIRWVDISGCKRVTDGGVQSLAVSCQRLQHLNLSSTGINNKSVVALARYCYRTLQSVKLSFCKNLTLPSLRLLLRNGKRLHTVHLFGLPGLQKLQNEFGNIVQCEKETN